MDPIVFGLYDASGNPLTGVAPVFVHYLTRGGQPRSAPVVNELGGGLYSFLPSQDDRDVGVAALLDCGVTATPRYITKAVHAGHNPFAAFHFETASGGLISSGTPTVEEYVDGQTGTPLTAYMLTGLTAYLWTLTPAQSGRTGFKVMSPAGAFPTYYDGDFEGATEPAPFAGGCTVKDVLVDARVAVSTIPISRDGTRTFQEHKTNQPFEAAPASRTEFFEVIAQQQTLTSGFGRRGLKEGEFRMVVRVGHPPFERDFERENIVQRDVARIADILEAHDWPDGVMGVWFEGVQTVKDDANWWRSDLTFRVVYYGGIES